MKLTKKLLMLMALPMLLGLASCAEHDNAVAPNPLAEQVKGLWWTLVDTEGTLPENFSGQDYTRMGMAYGLNDDGTGYGVTFFFNDESGDPIYVVGGEGVAKMTYTTTQDGRISVDFGNAYQEYRDYYKQFTVTYRDGLVTLSGDGKTITLDRPSEAMAALIHEWDSAANGGASADNYNINDVDFTPTNWREQEAIYLYDGTGQDATDAKGRTGYTLVNMPWYEGDVLTNLPNGFCDNITPENGWEWVLNRCGSRNIVNNNFFALYNKYTGILRFFYYMPYGFNAGNDHVWQVSMTDHLAQHSLWLYGLPSDRTLTNKTAIGQSGSGTFMEYVTPWVDYLSQDGLITPNAGWWAFDVDLSLYRPDDISADNIKLQMRSWEKHTTSLYSAMTADIDGTIKAKLKLEQGGMKSASTAKGVLMGLQAAASVGSTIASFYTGNWAVGLTSLSSVFGTGSQLAGLANGRTSYTGSFDGTISLGLYGDINTDGAIEGSKATTGISSPTLYLKDFDLKNSHLGQGVWNLKTSPVVYRVRDAVLASGVGYDGLNTDNRNHPYRDFMTTKNNDGDKCLNLYSMPTFLDPSSIEVELNPEVFPESEIEWTKVDAMCGWRPGMGFDGTDDYRNACGLSGRGFPGDLGKFEPRRYMTGYGERRNWDNPLCDFLHNSSDKQGMSYPFTTPLNRSTYWEFRAGAYGRGNSQYILEPQVMFGKQVSSNLFPDHVMPALEVTVIVTVKMKGMSSPLLLSRTYLPEYKTVNSGYYNLMALYNNIEGNMLRAPMQKLSELNQYQLDRIKSIVEWMDGYNKVGDYVATYGTGDTGNEGYQQLFDGNDGTKWCTNLKEDGMWVVEFKTDKPIAPFKYYLTTANDTKTYPGRNPKSWKLFARAKESDTWKLTAYVTNDSRLPADNFKRVEYHTDLIGYFQQFKYQYFRLEILEVQSGEVVQLSEFVLGD